MNNYTAKIQININLNNARILLSSMTRLKTVVPYIKRNVGKQETVHIIIIKAKTLYNVCTIYVTHP